MGLCRIAQAIRAHFNNSEANIGPGKRTEVKIECGRVLSESESSKCFEILMLCLIAHFIMHAWAEIKYLRSLLLPSIGIGSLGLSFGLAARSH